ncbi:POK9 protein, partial [Callaeas wilsoni]|nr:POK9 protein [Callaeas wilsoni]
RGSLGLDLAAAVDVTLVDNRPQEISTGVHGPIQINDQPCGALLLGRSSSGLKGLFVLPGITDADCQGDINIVVQTHFPPIHIPKGSKIAQLVPMQRLTAAMEPACAKERGSSGFGSAGGLAMLTLALTDRPAVMAHFQHAGDGLSARVLLDSGSDLTIMC